MKKHLVQAAIVAGSMTLASVAGAQSITINTDRAPGPAPADYYVARPGDTLFTLAGRFLSDPMAWPLLWSYNPQITNPHWIYPGDIIFLRPEAEPEMASPTLGGLYYPMGGFYTGDDLENVGEIRYADTGRRMLQPLDEIYLSFEDRDAVSPGDEFVIYHALDRVYTGRRKRKELVAVKYEPAGIVRVVASHEETDLFTAVVVSITDELERGDALFVSSPTRLRVEPTTNQVDLEGAIYDVLEMVRHVHEQDVVFIDLGAEDGVQVGNRFRIWTRQDEAAHIEYSRYTRRDYDEDVAPEIPWQLVGEALVTHVTEEFSTCVVTNADRELTAGFYVTMTRGE